jgi:polyisoprenoid-binding protein YceI
MFMKKPALILLVLALQSAANAQTWKVDKNNTRLGFTAVHLLISEVHGSFAKFDVKLTSTKEDFTDAQIELSADVASINTNVEMRDNNLRSASYLDAEKFPTMTFKSESLKKVEGKKYNLQGILTLHGVSKPVTLDVIYNGAATSPANKLPVVGFKVIGTIKRTDFKIGENAVGVSDDIQIEVDAEFFKMAN